MLKWFNGQGYQIRTSPLQITGSIPVVCYNCKGRVNLKKQTLTLLNYQRTSTDKGKLVCNIIFRLVKIKCLTKANRI